MRSNQVRLNCGVTMPLIGLGTYSFQNDRKTTELAVHMALKMGYRHFDTAKIYGSEAALGNSLTEAIQDGTVQREDIFVTSKLWGSHHHDPVSALKQTLKNMGMEHLDIDNLGWYGWKCLDLGLCRSVGLSNFSSKKVEQLLEFANVPPAVNQVEMHPMWRQARLREVCGDHKIHVSAYSPTGGPGNSWGFNTCSGQPSHPVHCSQAQSNCSPGCTEMGVVKGVKYKLEERKIMRGEFLVNQTTSPYKTLEDLWDDEI
ncbi:hypothetical protein M0R45_037820 [Rubus argutus]|uniref:NADP-dependent oxidoreductase domain-containing protein n=1 Tax=Rubus argutus TaxID=59490 RepID=A0AAW1W379_RUBAR